jgi:flagellar basal-body rod protein FlgG
MSTTFGMIHRAMSVDTDLVRIIAENIANAQTSGYQRKLGVQRPEFASLAEALSAQTATETAPLTTVADASPGTLAETRERLDIALSGAGSLIVATPNGEMPMRGGRLHIDDQGQLVNQQGDAVLGKAGTIHFSGAALDLNSVDISSDGTIRVAGDVIGQLRVEAAGTDGENATPNVLQGFLESSNVEPVTEMIKLMEVIRHFETTQKAARSYDDLMQQAITDLGKI